MSAMNGDPTMSADECDESVRSPTLSAQGRRLLDFMREHPAAPIFRNQSGNKLRHDDIEAVLAHEREVADAVLGVKARGLNDSLPDWLEGFLENAWRQVPYFRSLGQRLARFEDIPTLARHDLAADIACFVPDSVDISRLINFRTTGTTGHPLLIPSHPRVAGSYLAYHKRALRRFGIELSHGAGQVGVVLIGYQKSCFTYLSVTPTMGESGLAKINLHLNDWRSPDDRAAYLDALAPEVITGDPISFAALLDVATTIRPKALLSVSMMLSTGLRQALEERFGCPVVDVYSLNEVGPVAVFDPAVGGHVLLQHRLHVEIVDRQGRPVAPGERGEVTVTGGFNFCLPLVRYRTGDFAALDFARDDTPVLTDFCGRDPVRFQVVSGEWINNIDVTHTLKPLALSHYQLRQLADASLLLRLPANQMALGETARGALRQLFGSAAIALQEIAADEDDKVVQYASALPGACP